jgi:hypothetical protein
MVNNKCAWPRDENKPLVKYKRPLLKYVVHEPHEIVGNTLPSNT